VTAQTGEPDRAIAALVKLLSISCCVALALNVPGTAALLRLDLMFDPLRNDYAFTVARRHERARPRSQQATNTSGRHLFIIDNGVCFDEERSTQIENVILRKV
jgi:hypothetical protein